MCKGPVAIWVLTAIQVRFSKGLCLCDLALQYNRAVSSDLKTPKTEFLKGEGYTQIHLVFDKGSQKAAMLGAASCVHIKDKMYFPNLSRLDLCKTANISAPSPPQQHSEKAARQDPEEQSRIVELFDKLGFDALELMLKAIGETDKSKEAAWKDAINALCDSHPKIRKVCDSDPDFWIKLSKEIFKLRPQKGDEGNTEARDTHARDIYGEGLIYRTFRDDTSPRSAFVNMCKAKSLADALAKRFACFAITKYEEGLWELWRDHPNNVIENGDDMYYDDGQQYEYHMAHYQEIATETFPAIEYAPLWLVQAERDFNNHPSKDVYLKKYGQDPNFKRMVDNLLNPVGAYLFYNPNKAFIHKFTSSHNTNDPDADVDPRADVEKQFEIIHKISEVLGIYIVCLWKNKRDMVELRWGTEVVWMRHARDLVIAAARAIDLALGDVIPAQINESNNNVGYDSQLLDALTHPSKYEEAWVLFEKKNEGASG